MNEGGELEMRVQHGRHKGGIDFATSFTILLEIAAYNKIENRMLKPPKSKVSYQEGL